MNADAFPELHPEVVEDQVSRAMEMARRRAGLTAEEMARRLRPVLRLPEMPPDKEARSNWYGWRQNPRSIPAVALVSAARLAGTTVDALLSEALPTPATSRIAELEREVEKLSGVVGQIQADLIEARTHVGLPWTSSGQTDEATASEESHRVETTKTGTEES